MSRTRLRHTTLAANRYGFENQQLDLKPDTYRTDNLSKVLIGSLRDQYLDNYGQTTFDYDAHATTETFMDLANDGAFRDATFTWRDFDGGGVLRAKQTGIDAATGAPIMNWSSGPNPNKTTYAGLFNRGSFYKDYKSDQTMAGWDTEAMTGLSYDIVLDTSESQDFRRENAYKEHLRANNRMQAARKKADVGQITSDDNHTTWMQRPYSSAGTGVEQAERHTKYLPDGTAYLDKGGMWRDVRQRSVDAMKKLRAGGPDMFVPYERAGSGGQVIDSGKRQAGTSADEQRRAKVDTLERDRLLDKIGNGPVVNHKAWQADWLVNQETRNDSKQVDNLLNRISTNMTLSQPGAAYFQYDYHRLQDTNMTRRMLIQWARDVQERVEVKTDVDAEEERLIQHQAWATAADPSDGAHHGSHLTDTRLLDTRLTAALLVGDALDPQSRAYDVTDTDKHKLYERLARAMPGANIDDFVSQSGRVLQTIMTEEARLNAGARRSADAADVQERAETRTDSSMYESRMTQNGPAMLARAAPKELSRDVVGTDRQGFDTRLERTPLASNAKDPHSISWRRTGYEADNNPTGETRHRAASYAATTTARQDMAQHSEQTRTQGSGNELGRAGGGR